MGLSVFEYLLLVVLFSLKVVLSIDNNNYNRQDFPSPPHFVFGAGSSAYQIEGAAFEDGKTPSVWDTYVHAGYFQGGNGDIALDGYHKYKEDIQLMVETGFEAYRFSISWSRLIPNGRGAINPKGLEFYNNFINELIANGIEPHVTLFHHDLPQELEDEYGGWLSRKSTKDYVAFAEACFREFGDRVAHWTTFNEPNALALAGYDLGNIAPARCSSPFGLHCIQGNSSSEPYIVVHNILLAHASASSLYNQKYKEKQHGMIGLDLLAYWFEPYTNATEDILAAQRIFEYWVGWLLHPLVYGDYPEIVKKNAGRRVPVFTKDESASIKGSIDFVALNHYDTFYVRDKSSNLEMDNRDFNADIAVEIQNLNGNLPPDQRELHPWGLKAMLGHVKCTCGNLPVYIHENGFSLYVSHVPWAKTFFYTSHTHTHTQKDTNGPKWNSQMLKHEILYLAGYRTTRNGTLEDEQRVEYMRAYIGSLLDAVREGLNVRGYFSWAFLDVFELLDGYESSYGLYYVDLDDKDLKRQPKSSAKWYTSFLKGSSNLGLKEYENRSDSSNPHFSS